MDERESYLLSTQCPILIVNGFYLLSKWKDLQEAYKKFDQNARELVLGVQHSYIDNISGLQYLSKFKLVAHQTVWNLFGMARTST